MNEKKVWASKTLWANVLATGAVLATGWFSPEQIALGMGIGNMILRFLTKEKVVF